MTSKKGRVIEFMFKDQISPDHPKSNTNWSGDFTFKSLLQY